MLFDGTTRMSRNGDPVYYYSLVSSHAEYNIVPAQAAVPLRTDFPLDRAALLGYAVMTGYGGAVHAGRIEPGTSVIDGIFLPLTTRLRRDFLAAHGGLRRRSTTL